MNKPLISIITVCYNSEKTIKNTLDSMLKQKYDNYEYIIIDGLSTDNTINIIKEYEKKFNGKLKYISEKDNGIYDAMNKGIALCKGELIGIINSDDWYEEIALEEVSKKYKKESLQIIYGMQRLIKNEQEYDVVLKNHNFIKERMITHPSCFISKKIYDKYGMYNTKYNISADYEFMLRIYNKKDVEFNKIYSVLSNFRLGGESSTQQGVIETAKLRYDHNIISKKQYCTIIIRSKIYSIYKKISRS